MKTAIIVGHHQNGKGATSPFLGKSEFDFYSEVVELLKDEQGVEIFKYDPIKSYTARVKKLAKEVNSKGFQLVIELHFNAAIPQANGCETLYYFASKKSQQLAIEFSEVVNAWTGIKIRGNNGAKALVNENDRGFGTVYYYAAPTILIEPFFGSNETDCVKIKDAENMACIIKDFLARVR